MHSYVTLLGLTWLIQSKRPIFFVLFTPSFFHPPAPANLTHLSGSSFNLAEILRVGRPNERTNERMGDDSKLRKRKKNFWIKVNGFGRNGSIFSKVVQFEEERGWPQMLPCICNKMSQFIKGLPASRTPLGIAKTVTISGVSLYPVIFTICTHLKVKKLSVSA